MIDPLAELPEGVAASPAARQLLGQLAPEARALVADLLELMERSARRRKVSTAGTELTARQDPEDGSEKLVIRQRVDLTHAMAMEHWEKMGREIDRWVSRLPEAQAELLGEWTAFSVYAEGDDAAA